MHNSTTSISPLDLPLHVSFFEDHTATTVRTELVSLRDLMPRLRDTEAPGKVALPWLKIAAFGDVRSRHGSLRHNANVQSVTGIEADYDGEIMSLDAAEAALREAGIAAVLYTSPSHTPAKPRWRVLCPLSAQRESTARRELVGRLNAVLGGGLAGESFTLSQAYYYGRVRGAPDHQAVLVEGGYLDALALDPVYPLSKGDPDNQPRAVPYQGSPDATADAALAMACGLFADATTEGETHDVILDATRMIAPFVGAGLLDEAAAVDAIRSAMIEHRGREERHIGEVRAALAGALEFCPPYEPPSFGEEFFTPEALASMPAEDPDAWKALLARGKPKKGETEGAILSIKANVIVALHHAPELRGLLAYDEFACAVVLTRSPPWQIGPFTVRRITDLDTTGAELWLQQNGIPVGSKDAVLDAMVFAARRHSFHPVRDYLRSLAWDGTARLDTWLMDHLGAEDTPFNRAAGRCFLIAAVARVMQPGCQVDAMLILEGRQGLRKSSSLRALAHGWLLDNLGVLGDKDTLQQLRGKWVVEMAELDRLRGAEVSRAKQFLSTREDDYRPPYGRMAEQFPRQCVFAGTVNPGAHGYLHDDTGNRRFWTVACGLGWPADRNVDIAALEEAVPQLWAEAFARFQRSEAWHLSPDMEVAQAHAAEARVFTDGWTQAIRGYLADRNEASIPDILQHALGKPLAQQQHSDTIRVGRILQLDGWQSRQVRAGAGRERRYFRSDAIVPMNQPVRVVADGDFSTVEDDLAEMAQMLA